MSYNEKLTALHKGLTPIWPDQDRINFAPQLRGDIRLLLKKEDESLPNSYLTFNSVHDDGTIWVISELEGWFTFAEPEMPNITRGFGDGSFDVDGRFAARDITISGSIIIQSGSRADIDKLNYTARKELLEAFYLVRRGTWLIVDEDALIENPDYPEIDPTRQYLDYKRAAFVRLAEQPQIETVNSRGRIDFQIGLRAADPIKYEWVEDFGFVPDYEVISGNGYNLAVAEGSTPSTEYRTYTTGVTDWNLSSGSASDVIVREYADGTVSDVGYSDYSTGGFRAYSGDVNTIGNQQIGEGGIVATNHGNTDVGCYIRILGPIYGPAEIINQTTGQTMTILAGQTEGVPVFTSSQFLDIDTRTHEVHIGDFTYGEYTASSRGLLEPLTDWIYLQPGDNVMSLIDYGAIGAAPTLQVYWRSGWVG